MNLSKKIKWFVPALAALTLAFNANAGAPPIGGGEQGGEQGEEEPALPGVQVEILSKLHVINPAEVAVGNLAAEKACSADVKAYGAMLAEHHTAADAEVMAFAEARGTDLTIVAFSEEEQAQLDAHMAAVDSLGTLTDCAFDKAFLEAMRDGHFFALGLVRAAADAAAEDAELLAFLQATETRMTEHHDRAVELLAALEGDEGEEGGDGDVNR